MLKTAVVVSTYNRPNLLARSLPQIVAAAKEVDAPVLVISDGGEPTQEQLDGGIHWPAICLPENRGLAGVMNIGLSYFLADPSIEAISYFQDDVYVDPLCLAACAELLSFYPTSLVTGHDAKEHRERGDQPMFPNANANFNGIEPRRRPSCRATHMMAMVDSWKSVMPIRSRGIGLPSKTIRDAHHPEERGTGSGVDWWVVRDSPNKLPVLCIPGLVRSFAHKKEDSTWDNESIGGEESSLHREAIKGWIINRRGKSNA